MPIQLVIRHNLEGHEATFLPGEFRTFSRPVIRIGTRPECDCVLAPDPELPPELGTLEQVPGTGKWILTPVPAVPLFLNGEAVDQRTRIRSGDEIRCGHWTLRFHKAPREARIARRADALAVCAKVLVALILAAEVGLLSWLPRQIERAQLWELQIARQRALMRVDALRRQVGPGADATPFEKAMFNYLGNQVDRLTLYLRQNSALLSREQIRAIDADVSGYDAIITRIRERTAFRPVASLDLDAALRNVLQNTPGRPPAP